MTILRDRKTLIAAGATVAVLAGGWFGVVSPAVDKHSELVAQTEASQASSDTMPLSWLPGAPRRLSIDLT